MKELDIKAQKDNLVQVLDFVNEQIAQFDCPKDILIQLDIAVEEIFVNIASYAYDPEMGPALIRTEIKNDPLRVCISFIDNGKPYDPLAKPDPDLSLPLMKRKKGGLGIFMVKKTMDDMTYEYKDGQNILTITKAF